MSTCNGPLEGLRVIDLSAVISGPMATQMLGDQGAEVIKVEPPGIGDLTRPMGTSRNGLSAIYAAVNRNKRAVILDLGQEAGLEAFRKLVATADVLVQNFRPGAAERMGIGYEAMSEIRPDLVYASICGFGFSGPHAQRRVYDPLIQAASGMAWAQGQGVSSDGRPALVRTIALDKVTALTAAQAITAALFARERGLGGQHVRLSMLDAAIAFHWSDMMWNHSFLDDSIEDFGEIAATADLADMYRIYDTADGQLMMVAGSDIEFRGVCRAFGQEELADEARYATIADRMAHIAELIEWQTRELARRAVDEVVALLDDNGVPCSKVNSIADLATDAQVRHNGSVRRVEHPIGGAMHQAEPPVEFCRTPTTVRSLAPAHGEHSEEILAELGYTHPEVERLREAGVLG
ncbi:MAG: CoA transferase [Acidobacteriota bacterium]|nr:CoA transferase [Acidobacteriota bacterium]